MKKSKTGASKKERRQTAHGVTPSALTSSSTSRKRRSTRQNAGTRSTINGYSSSQQDSIRALRGLRSSRLRAGICRNPYSRHYSMGTSLRTNGHPSLQQNSRSASGERRYPKRGRSGAVSNVNGQALPTQTKSSGGQSSFLQPEQSCRRSPRIVVLSTEQVQTDRQLMMEYLIRNGCQEGLKEVMTKNKGRGVVATREFEKDHFVVECAGELLSRKEGMERDLRYKKKRSIGCYMYYFTHDGKRYCVDATKEDGKLGRLINHSRGGNCRTRLVTVEGRPHLVLVAARHINIGEELSYDYGDKDPDVIRNHPWLKH